MSFSGKELYKATKITAKYTGLGLLLAAVGTFYTVKYTGLLVGYGLYGAFRTVVYSFNLALDYPIVSVPLAAAAITFGLSYAGYRAVKSFFSHPEPVPAIHKKHSKTMPRFKNSSLVFDGNKVIIKKQPESYGDAFGSKSHKTKPQKNKKQIKKQFKKGTTYYKEHNAKAIDKARKAEKGNNTKDLWKDPIEEENFDPVLHWNNYIR